MSTTDRWVDEHSSNYVNVIVLMGELVSWYWCGPGPQTSRSSPGLSLTKHLQAVPKQAWSMDPQPCPSSAVLHEGNPKNDGKRTFFDSFLTWNDRCSLSCSQDAMIYIKVHLLLCPIVAGSTETEIFECSLALCVKYHTSSINEQVLPRSLNLFHESNIKAVLCNSWYREYVKAHNQMHHSYLFVPSRILNINQ